MRRWGVVALGLVVAVGVWLGAPATDLPVEPEVVVMQKSVLSQSSFISVRSHSSPHCLSPMMGTQALVSTQQ